LIGRRARKARLDLGLTVREVGERWATLEGRDKPYPPMKIWLIEHGRRVNILEWELSALAGVFQKPLGYFTDPEFPET